MEKVQWNSINKKQNGLEKSKMKNHPPSPIYSTILRLINIVENVD